jgi:predicted dithiol-disulfide oxidoreductase (DUF899 family)
MDYPQVVSRDEWLVARRALLAREKEFTRQRDALNAQRRRLPRVRIDKEYIFEGPAGKLRLFDLFDGRRQLIVYHFMFDPSWGRRLPDVLVPGRQHRPPRPSARARHLVACRIARDARQDPAV